MNISDTICAIATAQGGAIGIIRISGYHSIAITDRIFFPVGNNLPLAERKPYTIAFGQIRKPLLSSKSNDQCCKNTNGKNYELIDEVLVSIFHAPHSYTGENSVEISCHGSSYIMQQIIALLIDNGCRLAKPGEYTQRAFVNGKMDLSQAEAVADLIASTSESTHRLAMNQMRGTFSKELAALRDKLLHLTSLMELELDFSDHEELEFADRKELHAISLKIEKLITGLMQSFRLGNAIKNGIPVAIIGETNAGKSTLLNTLVGEERAIVSDIHGTTRDVIEDTVNISGFTFRFIDTAGIRETTDTIESIGIERTFKKICQAEIVLLLIDSTDSQNRTTELFSKISKLCNDKKLIIVYNKTDLVPENAQNYINVISHFTGITASTNTISISAKTGKGITELKKLLVSLTGTSISPNDVIVTNIRHFEALSRANDSIHRVNEGLCLNIPGDLISQDLRECLSHLSEITGGEITTDEVLGNIFKNFCVGK
ncbi:tRNA uridine-5-carboxymethylaminomethyl(34) synthesis GTPase MnmE [Xylanibacter muris]|uniref:tRNA modification GTPase MnmE n=1 Tax=Xylanibacter muris TaxID=2736290 RepID=A0ABX2ASW3_9BACT|nr:tRNA uridine-5-carboxymethylaminomethyl(34) synthesis GTPase MnmE [Xylanibacter muris]NPD93112.1 tRNA uridine-5-carboxymethylaminomethyl(34) synthesis GTPase MnmE [Xylanibacter muris]